MNAIPTLNPTDLTFEFSSASRVTPSIWSVIGGIVPCVCDLFVVLFFRVILDENVFNLGHLGQMTCKSVSDLLDLTNYGRYYITHTNLGKLAQTLDFFKCKARAITPGMNEYVDYVVESIGGQEVRVGEFLNKTEEMGKEIRTNIQIISTMKCHWVIAKKIYEWTQLGNKGQITVR